MMQEKQKKLTVDIPYKSPLERLVPFVPKDSEWYANRDNWKLCTHCKENEIPKTKFMLVPFCVRCYSLMALKHDGTYIIPEFRVGLAQDFDDLQKGKVKVTNETAVKEIIVEDLPPIV
jgi:hypothetical protein